MKKLYKLAGLLLVFALLGAGMFFRRSNEVREQQALAESQQAVWRYPGRCLRSLKNCLGDDFAGGGGKRPFSPYHLLII